MDYYNHSKKKETNTNPFYHSYYNILFIAREKFLHFFQSTKIFIKESIILTIIFCNVNLIYNPVKIDYNVNLIISGLIRYDQIISAKSEIL